MKRSSLTLQQLADKRDGGPELSDLGLSRIKNSHEQLLEFVEACSKVAQKSWVFDLAETQRLSRLQGKAEYMLQNVVEKKFLSDPSGHSYKQVNCDFEVKETHLAHDYDLKALHKRVLDLFDWHNYEQVRCQYLAPYFPLIQSSGMGKTKLLYELKRLINHGKEVEEERDKYHCVLVLCSSGELEGDMTQTYDLSLELEECMKHEPDPSLKYRQVEQELETVCHYHGGKPVILLFDEAQNLLVGKDNHLFNCIQWWLCKKNKQPNQVVAVFAGTTLQFATMKRDPPESYDWGAYYMDGYERYPPFYHLHTMGCLVPRLQHTFSERASEFDRAVPYGRPLFAKMGQRGLLEGDNQVDILTRLILSHTDTWWTRSDSCFSVLATRVQMGQTSLPIAIEVVSRGYAILADMDPQAAKSVEICHLPDPVCARLAMCLMKDDWECAPGERNLRGKSRSFWVEQMTTIFSENTCIPSAGDVGEVFVALYILFCGDKLRFSLGKDCKQFSVSLTQWISLLIHGGTEQAEKDVLDASVNFIQVTQNYLRYADSMSNWTQQHFLKHLYTSGSAFYVFEDCSVFDIFGSIRYSGEATDDPVYMYCPLLISIISRSQFSNSEATSACCAMEMQLTRAGCYCGLCIVLVLGRINPSDFDEDLLMTVEDVANVPNEIVAKVIQIPSSDEFGITDAFWRIASDDTEKAEVFASHSFLSWQQEDDISNQEFLRSGKRMHTNGNDAPLGYVKEIREALCGDGN